MTTEVSPRMYDLPSSRGGENALCGHVLPVRGDATLTDRSRTSHCTAVTMQFGKAMRLVLVPEIPL
jgi:hypothetical protein